MMPEARRRFDWTIAERSKRVDFAMTVYSKEFYKRIEDSSRRSAQVIVPLIVEYLRPRSIIDIGCGTGAWLSVFQEHGVQDVVGVDGSYVDTRQLAIPRDKFIPFDLTRPFQTARTFDLVVSLEVGEHLPGDYAEAFVDWLIKLGSVVLFSAAIPFQGGIEHINEQWPDYWAAFFRARGFVAIDCIRKRVWQDERVHWWYAQNVLLYAHHLELEKRPVLKREYEVTAQTQLSIVHPKLFVGRADLKSMAMRNLLVQLPFLFMHAVRRTLRPMLR